MFNIMETLQNYFTHELLLYNIISEVAGTSLKVSGGHIWW